MTFTFIIHHRTLLDLTLEALDSPIQEFSEIGSLPWDVWGRNSTRMFADDSTTDDCSTTSSGTRFILLQGPQLEVLDFACHKTNPPTMQRGDNRPDAKGVPVHLVGTESIYPVGAGPFTQDVRTNLPYVSSRRLVGLEDRLWEGVFMDDERIVGFTSSAIHILHLQP